MTTIKLIWGIDVAVAYLLAMQDARVRFPYTPLENERAGQRSGRSGRTLSRFESGVLQFFITAPVAAVAQTHCRGKSGHSGKGNLVIDIERTEGARAYLVVEPHSGDRVQPQAANPKAFCDWAMGIAGWGQRDP